MMQPTRISTVIEMFYPQGFAHDYQWTTRALGMPVSCRPYRF
jgi:hypothetical protein